jgi:DNA-directed RNA polymerase specialized sigma subunit
MSKKTPVDDFIEFKSKEAAERASKDLELWQQWDQSGRSSDQLQPLMQRYQPLINRKVKEWKAPAVSPAAFKAELQKHFIRAAQTFDPGRGVAFNTYVQNTIQKAKRFNAKHQNVGYIPEGKARFIGPIQVAQNQLEEEFGRPPTPQEIGQHVGLEAPKVTGIMQSMRKDVPSSAFETDPTNFSAAREQDVIRIMSRRPEEYFDADEAKVFKHIYGVGSAKITSTKDLATQLGTSQSRISRLKTSIGQKIKNNI